MADQYINPTGLQAIKEWAVSKFTNKIEKIRVNGGEKTPDANKAVDLVIPDYNHNDGAGNKLFTAIDSMNNPNYFIIQRYDTGEVHLIWQPYTGDTLRFKLADQNYVDKNGGKIDKIKLNGVEQPISNKEVSLITPYFNGNAMRFIASDVAGEMTISQSANGVIFTWEDVSGLSTNELVDKTYADDTFRTEAQVQQAIDDALADVIGIDFQVVDTLPDTGVKGVIYLLGNTGTAPNTYDEYIWVTPTGGTAHYEKIGTTDVDLSNYWTSASGHANSLEAMTVSEINAILNA